MKMSLTRLSYTILIAGAIFLAAELAARHAIDLKYYGSDSEVGFWLLPDQSGGSLLVNSFAINAAGFNVAERYTLEGPNDMILVGDSLVAGHGIDQGDKLGVVLQDTTGWQVWPLSTGGWALANELRAIERKPIEGAEAIVFVLNAADFGDPAEWTSDYDLPRAEPSLYTLYAIQKEFPIFRGPSAPVPVRKGNLEEEWQKFRSKVQVPVFVIGYDSAATTNQNCQWLPAWITDPIFCFDPIARGERGLMTDPIHLGDRGTARLASFIASNVQTAFAR